MTDIPVLTEANMEEVTTSLVHDHQAFSHYRTTVWGAIREAFQTKMDPSKLEHFKMDDNKCLMRQMCEFQKKLGTEKTGNYFS